MDRDLLRQELQDRHFLIREDQPPFDLLAESERVFVAVKSFAALEGLLQEWEALQADLADRFFPRLAPSKLWDTYLVCIVPGLRDLQADGAQRTARILNDTAYCRKLLIDPGPAQDPVPLEWRLLPLFPPALAAEAVEVDPLRRLRERLLADGVPPQLADLVERVDAQHLLDRAREVT